MKVSIEDKLQKILSRIRNISFFNPLTIDDAQFLLPYVQEMIDESRDALHRYYNSKTPFERPKKIAYKEGLYTTIRKYVVESNEIVNNKLSPLFSKLERNHYQAGGSWVWDPVISRIGNRVRRDVTGYVWGEAVRDVNQRNPCETLMCFYELCLFPVGFENVSFIDEDGDCFSIDGKFVIDFPLDKNQAKSNIARGKYILRDEDWQGYRLSPKDKHLLELVKGVRRSIFGDFAILSKPEIMESYCLATYIDGEQELKHVYYWSESYRELRPLII